MYVDHEYHQETLKNRKILYQILKAARNHKDYQNLCKLEGDTLTIKGRHYTVKSIGHLPAELNGFHVSSKSDDKTYVFFGELNPFSNFHPTPLTHENTLYKTSEHFIQFKKAKHYRDLDIAMKIISTDSALDTKWLGHKLKNPKEVKELNEIAKEMCYPGIKAKFQQSTPPLLLLHSTKKQTLVEASFDTTWGTGVPLRDLNCLNKKHWKNVGILGEILMEIRKESHSFLGDITSQNNDLQPDNLDMTNPNTKDAGLKMDMTNQNA